MEEFAPRYGQRWELLVVLNGCTDGTPGVVEAWRARCPQVRSLEFPEPLGKGGALMEGLARARGRRIAYVDADNMVGPSETARLLEALERSDVAIGWRRWTAAPRPWPRRLAGQLVRLWTRRFLGLPYHDTQCGAKALRRGAAAAILPLLRERGWAMDVELLMAARALRLEVEEVPVTWRHAERGSKLRLLGAGREFLAATWRLRRGRGRLRP